jgi:hypothetical protein
MNKKTGLLITHGLYLFIIISLLAVALYPYIAVAKGVEPETKEIEIEYVKVGYSLNELVPQDYINQTIAQYASGNKAYQMSRTIWCESRNRNVQSNVIKKGVREDSWGIAQIHLPSHPSVSRTQALDVDYSIKWMSEHWNDTKWYGYNRASDSCNN